MPAGVDGIFFSTQMATTDLVTREEYEEFGRPYDLQRLEAPTTGLVVLRIHGVHIMFDLCAHYPGHVAYYHAPEAAPTIAVARATPTTAPASRADHLN